MRKVKYAIYRGKIGLYAKEYFDTLDKELFEDRGVLGYWHIKPENLPIVVNRSGGRCSFYPVEDNFVEIREVDEDAEPLTREECYPKNSSAFEYGWIDPDGNTYNTGHEGHLWAADMIYSELHPEEQYVSNGERKLEESGWVKVAMKAPYDYQNPKKFLYAEGLKITKKQADTLVDLGYSAHEDFLCMLDHSEPEW